MQKQLEIILKNYKGKNCIIEDKYNTETGILDNMEYITNEHSLLTGLPILKITFIDENNIKNIQYFEDIETFTINILKN